MPSREEVKAEYDRLYKDNPTKWVNTERSDFMIQVLKGIIPNPKTVIDVGCGNGSILESYHKYNPTADIYGIDLSEEGLKLAQDRVPNGNFTSEDEFKNRKRFDLVMCLGVAEHVEELLEFLKSLKARVKKEGFCYFEVPHNLLYSPGPETYRRLKTRSQQLEWHYPRSKWKELILEAGFEIIAEYTGLKSSWEFVWVLK